MQDYRLKALEKLAFSWPWSKKQDPVDEPGPFASPEDIEASAAQYLASNKKFAKKNLAVAKIMFGPHPTSAQIIGSAVCSPEFTSYDFTRRLANEFRDEPGFNKEVQKELEKQLLKNIRSGELSIF